MLGMPNKLLSAVCLAILKHVVHVFRVAVPPRCSWYAEEENRTPRTFSIGSTSLAMGIRWGVADPTSPHQFPTTTNVHSLVAN